MSDKNPWEHLAGEGYRLTNLGRPAVFFIPTAKLEIAIDGKTIREHLDTFLIMHFRAFTRAATPSVGLWVNGQSTVVTDMNTLYEVSFLGREHIAPLIAELARLCRLMDEDCLYFKAGEDACLIAPT